MITIRLLGGAKKALGGTGTIVLDSPEANLSEILRHLQSLSSEPRLLDPANLILAVNGVDSAALHGESTTAKSGDTVTVVTVVHGGSFELDGTTHVVIIGIKRIVDADPGATIDALRERNTDVLIQAVRADSVYRTDHVLEVLRIVLEARKRGIMIANKAESELLLRLAFTDQISQAISRAGLKQGESACFVAFSEQAAAVKRFAASVESGFEVDNSVLKPDSRKSRQLATTLGLEDVSEDQLLSHLIERAAILVR